MSISPQEHAKSLANEAESLSAAGRVIMNENILSVASLFSIDFLRVWIRSRGREGERGDTESDLNQVTWVCPGNNDKNWATRVWPKGKRERVLDGKGEWCVWQWAKIRLEREATVKVIVMGKEKDSVVVVQLELELVEVQLCVMWFHFPNSDWDLADQHRRLVTHFKSGAYSPHY